MFATERYRAEIIEDLQHNPEQHDVVMLLSKHRVGCIFSLN